MKPPPHDRVDVLGVRVSAIDMNAALETIDAWIRSGSREYVCVTGVHGVMESQKDPELAEIHNRSGLTTPDGMPMVWCGHYAGIKSMRRVYGPDLMLETCRAAVDRSWRMYFYGAAPGIPELLASRLEERFPGLEVVGTHSPPYRALTEEEETEICDRINATNPDVVWVGLSTPKQERWMSKMRGSLDAPVLIGVGAAFDIHAGTLPQAPAAMQRSGLEWLYRLYKEPRRLWRRYMTNNPRFVLAIIRSRPKVVA